MWLTKLLWYKQIRIVAAKLENAISHFQPSKLALDRPIFKIPKFRPHHVTRLEKLIIEVYPHKKIECNNFWRDFCFFQNGCRSSILNQIAPTKYRDLPRTNWGLHAKFEPNPSITSWDLVLDWKGLRGCGRPSWNAKWTPKFFWIHNLVTCSQTFF